MTDATAVQAPDDVPPVPVFDGHNDTILRVELAERMGTPRDLAVEDPTPAGSGGFRSRRLDIDLPRAEAAGFAGGFFAMFTPTGQARPPAHDHPINGEGRKGDGVGSTSDATPTDEVKSSADAVDQARALAFTTRLLARLHQLARSCPDRVAIVDGRAAIETAMAHNRLAILPHIEGAECIDEDLAALETLHSAGLRSLGPVWSRPNAFGHGAPMAPQPEIEVLPGLTDAGRALVATCEAMGVMIDCSHLTETGFWDVAAVTDQPLVATHSNAHAICPSARNLTNKQLDAVAERGGVVGLNFHVAFLRPDCRHNRDTGLDVMLRHLDHLLAHLGEEGVALGSDFDGCLLPREIGDVTGLPKLVEAMRAAGYGETLVERIAWRNWLGLIGRVIG
ncbi:MAG: membrane dipeptidase [Pseudomonadota bacterium]